ncbi:MAG: polyketide cyclase / dehydrase and lipid transport family protein [Acidimicrobiia bacterium]|nr:polyketide cyclase / dehydrase and lipid transport family protein [Acidimicrobiia bacterium]
MPSDTGTLSLAGDVTEITFERQLDSPPSVVWQAIATADGVTRWLVTEADMGDVVGGEVRLVFGDDAVVSGTITERSAELTLAHGWDYGPDARSAVAWSLTPSGPGTLLALSHRGLPPDQARGYLPGWHAYLDRLASVLAGEESGDWAATYAAAAERYAD